MKYSIIIPVYNAEGYLETCVGSILKQNAPCEIILIDDGSTDNSSVICDRFASEYDSVRTLHVPNGGAGRARNIGVGLAEGEYIMFADADDYLSEDFFESLEKSDVDDNADVVFFPAVKVFCDSYVPMADGLKREKIHKKTKSDVLLHMSECSKFPASCWGKIINRRFYLEIGICLSEELVGEDIDWSLALIEKAESFDLFEGGAYFYRKSHGTRSSHKNTKNVSDQLTIIEKWKCHPFKENERGCFMSFLAYQYAMIFPFYGALDTEKRKDYRLRMKKSANLLKYGKTKKLKAIRLFAGLLGIDVTSRLLYNYVLRRDKGSMK